MDLRLHMHTIKPMLLDMVRCLHSILTQEQYLDKFNKCITRQTFSFKNLGTPQNCLHFFIRKKRLLHFHKAFRALKAREYLHHDPIRCST